MSNFFNSKSRILAFIFNIISVCAIIGFSVMLSLGDKKTINVNNNLSQQKAASSQLSNNLDSKLEHIQNNTKLIQEDFKWKTNVDFISLSVLEARRNNKEDWRLIDKKSTETGGRNVGYSFILDDNTNQYLSLNHGKHPDTEFKVNLNKINPSDVLEGIDPSKNTQLKLNWRIQAENNEYIVNIDQNNYLMIRDNSPDDPFSKNTKTDFILYLDVIDQTITKTLSKNTRIECQKEEFEFKNIQDLLCLGVLEARRNKDDTWRLIDKKSTETGGVNVGYDFIFRYYKIDLTHNQQPDNQFRINLTKIKPSDILANVDSSRNSQLELQWKIEKSKNARYSATIDKVNGNTYLTITNDSSNPFPNFNGSDFKIYVTVIDKTIVNYQPQQVPLLTELFIHGKLETFNLKSNGINLIPLNALEAKDQKGNWRLISKQTIDSGIDRGYQFYISDKSSDIIQSFNLNHSFHPDTNFRIDLTKIKASDILEGINSLKNNELNLEWSMTPNPYGSIYNGRIEGNYLIIEDSTPNNPYDSAINGGPEFSVKLKITDKTIQNDQGQVINIDFYISGQELKYKLKNNNNLLSIKDLVFSSETNPNDLKPIDSKPGYEFYSSYYFYENKLTLNTSTYKDKYFKIDFSKVKATDIIQGVTNDNFELTWMLDNKPLPSNILEFTYDDTHPWPSNLSLLVVDKSLTNPQLNNYPIPIKFEKIAYGVSIPNSKSVNENDALTISDSEINIAGVSGIDLANAKYHWESLNQTNNQWEPIKGQTNETLTINNISIPEWNNKQVRLVIDINSKTLTSNACLINVTQSPQFNIDVSITPPNECFDGDSLTITSTIKTSSDVDQTLFKYQWVDVNNNKPIPGQTNKDFNLNPVDMTWDGRQVKLRVTYNQKTYESNIVTISVKSKETIPPIKPDKPSPTPPPKPQQPINPSLPSNVTQIGVGSSNYGFTYDINGNIISSQHWQGSYLSSVQKAKNLIIEIDNKLSNPNLVLNEINLLQTQKEICNKMILASNLVISGSVLVGLFGIIFIISLIVMIEFSKFWK